VGGLEGGLHVEGWYGWAGLMLTLLGAEEGMGFEEGHYFYFFCINLHAISNTPLLTDMKHSLQFAWKY